MPLDSTFPARAPASSSAAPYSLLLQLETTAVPGTQAQFDVLQSLLGDQGLRLSPGSFGRHVLAHPVNHGLAGLLSELGSGLKPDRLGQDLDQGLDMWLRAPDRALDPGLRALLEGAAARSWSIGVFSFLEESLAQDLGHRLGLDALGATILPLSRAKSRFVYDDAWQTLAASLTQSPMRCWALAHDQLSARGALGAGMQVVAVPGRLTAFQDYSGVDELVEALTPESAKALLSSLAG